MILSVDELRGVYESAVRASGHPDPIGYMARAILDSGGDPDYIGVDGKVGFMPVHPDYAAKLVGATEVQSLQGNIIATLAMDIILFQQTQDLRMSMILFHDGQDATQQASDETQDILDELDDARQHMHDTLFPRLATVEDVIKLLGDDGDDNNVTDDKMKFFEYLSNG